MSVPPFFWRTPRKIHSLNRPESYYHPPTGRSRVDLYIGIDLGGHHVSGALVTDRGKVMAREALKTSAGRGRARVLEQIARICSELSGVRVGRNRHPKAVGIGVPGFLNHAAGTVISSPNFPGWENYAIVKALKRRIPYRVVLENDANCAARGEQWLGAGKGHGNIVLLTLGTGVGGGLIADGRLLRGSRGAGGEVGHIVIDPSGPLCGCGGCGCLESFVSGTALKRDTGFSGEDLHRKAQNGEKHALKAFGEMGRHLGMGLASLSFLFDPDVFILGGKLSAALPLFGPAMRMEMDSRLRKHPAKKVPVRRARCGNDAGMLGAARMAMEAGKGSHA
ncbi:MAG: ROK family protein [Pseudomonadota bacterium]